MKYVNIENLNLIEEEIISISLIKDDTYDIEIEDVHHYILENGIISHNSSIFAGVISGGIEPVFMKEYTRWAIVNDYEKRKLRNQGFEFPNTNTGEWFETKNLSFSKRGTEKILKGSFNNIDYEIDKNRGLIKAVDVIDYGWKWILEHLTEEEIKLNQDTYSTTCDLTVKEHIDALKIISHYTDQNSSKTINLPDDYPFEDFKNLYMDAWKNNIKGLTTYRAGTMTAVLEKKKIKDYQTELEKMFEEEEDKVIKDSVKIPIEYYSKGFVRRDNNGSKWYFNVCFVDSKYKRPFAIFTTTNSYEHTSVADKVINDMEGLCLKEGISNKIIEHQREKYTGKTNVDKIARAIGMALRHNIKIYKIVKVLEENPDGFSTLLFHIRKLLSKYIEDGTRIVGEECPSCKKRKIIYEMGCKRCANCGWSLCD